MSIDAVESRPSLKFEVEVAKKSTAMLVQGQFQVLLFRLKCNGIKLRRGGGGGRGNGALVVFN